MAFNSTDYLKPPFTSGLMDLTEEEILYVQSELKKIAADLGVEFFTYDMLLAYCTPKRWQEGKWVNEETANYCFYYSTEEEVSLEEV